MVSLCRWWLLEFRVPFTSQGTYFMHNRAKALLTGSPHSRGREHVRWGEAQWTAEAYVSER